MAPIVRGLPEPVNLLPSFLPSPPFPSHIRHHTSTEDTETGHSLVREDTDSPAWITFIIILWSLLTYCEEFGVQVLHYFPFVP